MTMNDSVAALETRWRRFGIHRASRAAAPETWSTGWPALDALLPGGGYPLAAVTEFLVEQPGNGELSLLLTALKPRLNDAPDSRLVFVDPPHRLNAPALDGAGIDRARVPVICCRNSGERIWSIEQLATAGGFAGFVLWDDTLDTPALRRLQLASEKAGCPVFVYRRLACARQRSPAALRLALTCRAGRQRLEVLKCRGPAGATTIGLGPGRDAAWRWTPEQTPPIPPTARAANDGAAVALDPPAAARSKARSESCFFEADTSRPASNVP